MAVVDPDLAKFEALMDGQIQADIQRRELAGSKSAAFSTQRQPNRDRKKAGGGEKPARQPLSEEEKKRRKAIVGRCFRCGSQDHMMPKCKHHATIICGNCKQAGHMTSVCGRPSARQASAAPEEDSQGYGLPAYSQLDANAAAYYGQPAPMPQQQQHSAMYGAAMSSASAARQYSMDTPQVPL